MDKIDIPYVVTSEPQTYAAARSISLLACQPRLSRPIVLASTFTFFFLFFSDPNNLLSARLPIWPHSAVSTAYIWSEVCCFHVLTFSTELNCS